MTTTLFGCTFGHKAKPTGAEDPKRGKSTEWIEKDGKRFYGELGTLKLLSELFQGQLTLMKGTSDAAREFECERCGATAWGDHLDSQGNVIDCYGHVMYWIPKPTSPVNDQASGDERE